MVVASGKSCWEQIEERGEIMQNGFTRGLIVGSLIGASVSMMMNPDMMRNRTRKRLMRGGKNLMRRSGNLLGDVMNLLR